MYLGNPSLPISVEVDKARELAEKALRERNWKDFSIEAAKLIFVPYYFFEYNTYSEKEREGEKVVSGVERGKLVLNPETTEIMEGIAEQLPEEKALVHEIPDGLEFEAKKPALKEKDAENICRLKTAEKLGKPIEKVSVMNVGLFYVPLWELGVKLREEQLSLYVSAVNGSVLEEESIPYREKTAAEITRETLQELREPKAWVQYSKELLQLITKRKKGGEKSDMLGTIRQNKTWLITIILVIVLLIVMFWL